MPKKAKSKTKKSASRKSASKKPLKKKAIKKKTTAKRAVIRKKTAIKKTAKKKISKKRVSGKKAAAKRPSRPKPEAVEPKPVMIEPGPPAGPIPSVEEPAANEEAIGVVTHYYSHLKVAVVQINKGEIKTDDTIHIKGHTTDITQQVESMEYEHQPVNQAVTGQGIGLKVADHVREHDIVYRVK